MVSARGVLSGAPARMSVRGGPWEEVTGWAGPWLTQVCGWTQAEAAQGLFFINLAMLLAFFAWGALMPRLARSGITPVRLVAWGVPLPAAQAAPAR